MAGSTDNDNSQQKGYIAGAVEKTMEGLEKTKEYITGSKDKSVTEHMGDKASDMKGSAYNAHQNVMDTATDTKHDIANAAYKGADHAKHATSSTGTSTGTSTGSSQQKGYIGTAVDKTKEGLEKTNEYVRETVTGNKNKPVTEHIADKGSEMKDSVYNTAGNAYQSVMDTATDTKHDVTAAANKGADRAKHAQNKY
jgi:uncharacterized protein YxeA